MLELKLFFKNGICTFGCEEDMHFLLMSLISSIHKSLKVFTGQGAGKNNDLARNVVLRKSNHCDSGGDILRIENRQWLQRER